MKQPPADRGDAAAAGAGVRVAGHPGRGPDGRRAALVPRHARRPALLGHAGRPGRHRLARRVVPQPRPVAAAHRRRLRRRSARAGAGRRPQADRRPDQGDRRRARGPRRARSPSRATRTRCTSPSCSTAARSPSRRRTSTPASRRTAAPGTPAWRRSSSTPWSAASGPRSCPAGRRRSAGRPRRRSWCWSAPPRRTGDDPSAAVRRDGAGAAVRGPRRGARRAAGRRPRPRRRRWRRRPTGSATSSARGRS